MMVTLVVKGLRLFADLQDKVSYSDITHSESTLVETYFDKIASNCFFFLMLCKQKWLNRRHQCEISRQ